MTAATLELLQLATSIAEEAAALARLRREEGVSVAASKSSPEDVVTAADREVEAFIKGRLADARPGDGFVGEETGGGAGSTGLNWIVDPIDGTVNYLYGIPAYAVSIAVVEGGTDPREWTALAGAVVNPVLGETFAASAGGGAHLNGVQLSVSRPASLSLSLVGTGFGYSSERRARQAAVVEGLIVHVRDIRRIGSAALDLCSVAAGRLDAYYERGLNPWDLAAGSLVAREAGARVGAFGDDRESSDLLIAAHPSLYSELEPHLVRLGADVV